MTQVRIKNTREVFPVPLGSVLIVTPSRSTSAGRVTLNTSGVTPVGPWAVTGGSSTTIGPFTAFVDLTVESTSGTVFAEVTSAATLTAAQGAAGAVPAVMISRTSAQLAGVPSAVDLAASSAAVFYDAADPTKTFRINAAGTLYIRETDVGTQFGIMGGKLIGSRGVMSTNVGNGTDVTTSFRTRHVASFACLNPKVVLANVVCSTGGVETTATTTVTFSAAIEYPQGVVTPLTFAGAATAAVPNGSIVTTDAAGLDIPAGAIFWVRTCAVQASGTIWPLNTLAVIGSGNGGADGDSRGFKITAATKANPCVVTTSGNHNLSASQGITIVGATGMTTINGSWTATKLTATTFSIPVDTSAAGTFSGYCSGIGTDMTVSGSGAMAGTGGVNILCPTAVVGDLPYGVKQPWVTIYGDSIITGSGDTATSEGWFLRALGGFTTPTMPFIRLSIQGTRASQFADLTNAPTQSEKRRRFMSSPYVIFGFGTNDFDSGGRTLAQIQADQLALSTNAVNRGSRVIIPTLPPKTTSTDSWATATNQTPTANEAVRTAYNDWVRAGMPIDPTTKAAVAIGTSGALLAGSYGHPVWQAIDPWAGAEVNSSNVQTVNGGRWLVSTGNITANITNASATLTVTANTGPSLVVGAGVSGAGIPAGTTITALGTGTGGAGTYTMSQNASATTVGIAVTYAPSTDGVHPATWIHILAAAAVPVASMLAF